MSGRRPVVRPRRAGYDLPTMAVNPAQEEYLLKGRNGLETCLVLSEDYAEMFAKRKFMERETVREVLRRLNESGARYCLVGGLALAHHSIPRLTQDVDILILPEDLPLAQQALAGGELRGTAVVLNFQAGPPGSTSSRPTSGPSGPPCSARSTT